MQAIEKARQAQGLCRCGDEPTQGYKTCTRCRETNRMRQLECQRRKGRKPTLKRICTLCAYDYQTTNYAQDRCQACTKRQWCWYRNLDKPTCMPRFYLRKAGIRVSPEREREFLLAIWPERDDWQSWYNDGRDLDELRNLWKELYGDTQAA